MFKKRSPNFKRVVALCLYILLNYFPCAANNTIQLDGNAKWVCLQEQATYLTFIDIEREANDVLQLDKDAWLQWEDVYFHKKVTDIWIKFEIANSQSVDDSVFFNGQLFDYVELYEISGTHAQLVTKSGYLVPFSSKPIRYWGSIVGDKIRAKSKKAFLLRLQSTTRNSRQLMSYVTGTCMKAYTSHSIKATYTLHKNWMFFFFGAILIMAIYNLIISLSTQYKEYLLFALYNLLTVITSFVMSSQHLMLEWVPVFGIERNLRFIPAMFLACSYVNFSIKFLEIREYAPKLHRILNKMIFVYLSLSICLLFSLFETVFVIFALVTSASFLAILITAIRKSRKDKSARFFLIGNIAVCTVCLLQIASLYAIIPTKIMIFSSSIILMTEILTFSLAVAYKLKVSKRTMLDMKFSNQMQEEKLKMESEIRKNLELEVGKKARALTSSSIQWLNMSNNLEKLGEEISNSFKGLDSKKTKKILKQIEEIKNFEDQWNSFKIHFESVHPDFFTRIEKKHPSLSQNDLKVCAFMKMKLSNKQMAIILNVTKKAIEQSKRRMRKKLNLEAEEDILKHLDDGIKIPVLHASEELVATN